MDVGLNISVNITVGEFECSIHEVDKLANSNLIAMLKNDCINVQFAGSNYIIKNESKECYEFEVCTKRLPEPINVTLLSSEEKMQLLNNKAYMTGPEDYEKINWNITKVYNKMKHAYPNKNEFYLSSLAYSVKELELNNATVLGYQAMAGRM